MNAVANSRKRRGRPRTGIGGNVGLRLYPELQAALDAYIAGRPDPKPSRPEAIRALLRESLSYRGLLGEPEPPSLLAHRIKALENDIASVPTESGPSPEAALHTMDRALAEDELVRLRRQQAAQKTRRRPGTEKDAEKER